jgi:hypothetical protein
MPANEYCVYNETGENFLVPRVTAIDTRVEPLKAVKVLIEGLAPNADTGLWLNPLKSVPAVPRLSSYDLVYLDPQHRVLQAVALGADDDVPLIDGRAASALVLPIHTFSASHTHPGDRVILHVADQASGAESAFSASSVVAQVPLFAAGLTAPSARAVSSAQPAALEPTIAPSDEPQVLPPAVPHQKDSSGIGFLHSIVHLRVHISISITTSAPSGATKIAAGLESAELRSDPFPQAQKYVRGGARIVRAASAQARSLFAGCSATWVRRCTCLKRRYLRWAEVVVYGAPRVRTRGVVRTLQRSPRLEEEC